MNSRFALFFEQIQKDIKFYLFLLLLLCFYRGYFIFAMQEYLSEGTNFADIMAAMWAGFRLSLKSAGAGVLLGFVFCTLPMTAMPRFDLSKVRLYVGYTYIFILSVLFQARFPYYREFHATFNQNIFNTFKEDASALLVTMVQEYNMPLRLLLAIGLTLLAGFLLKRLLSSRSFAFPKLEKPIFCYGLKILICLFIPAFMVFMRFGGSFNYTHSISWENAGVTRDAFLNEIILDDIQALYRANSENQLMQQGAVSNINKEKIAIYAKKIAGDDRQAVQLEEYFKHTAAGPKIDKPKHIFVVIGESYAQWPLLEQYSYLHIADGLKGIIQEQNAFYSSNFVPVGAFTAQTLNGLVTGLTDVSLYPAYQPQTYKQIYATAIAKQFKELGYKTIFWHAGFPSSGRLGEFVLAQGFDEYIGSTDLNMEKTNIWGAKDGIFFDQIQERFSDDTPTFHVMMTVVNHPPYNLDLAAEGFPQEEFLKRIPENLAMDDNLLRVLGHYWYTDNEISKFVRKMYKNYPDSLFLITGDHADRRTLTPTPTIFERYTIPFVLYGKGVTKDILPVEMVGNHIHIAPTLIELIAPQGFTYYSINESLTKGNSAAFSRVVWMTDKAIGKLEAQGEEKLPGIENEVDFAAERMKVEEKMAMERTLSWWRLAKGNVISDD